MLFNGKAMACLMLLCLLLAQGCRKEVHLYPATQTDNLNPGPLIKAAKLDAWFATNPVARFLSPNWAKARQAKINDKRIVRVPLFNIDKATAIANATTAIEGKNANYNEKHPPEIIFVEDQIAVY